MTIPKTTMATSKPDLTHHLSSEAKARLPNPMKTLLKMLLKQNKSGPGVISLANGNPDSNLYPFHKVEWKVASVDDPTVDPVASLLNGTGSTQQLASYRDATADPRTETGSSSKNSSIMLSDALQYTHGAGLAPTQAALTKLTKLFHNPPDHIVTLTLGNSDGVSKAFRLLGERGDYFMADEFTFSAMTNAPLSYGVKWVGIKMDRGGAIPEDMERVLSTWDDSRGRRPHVLYIVPCGQNPTGSTLTLKRRKRIYEIAQKWDVIIMEDDPYYFLQFDLPESASPIASDSFAEQFAGTFPPSFLSMDVDGRVLRLDSFSKVLAPGMRLGWITSSAMFHEKLVSYTDSATQHPAGFSQVVVTEMLGEHGWGEDGLVRWMQGLCRDYQRRRDYLLSVFETEVAPGGYATVNVPQAGMFVWIEIHLQRHPRFRRTEADPDNGSTTNIPALMEELFNKFMAADLFVMPASIFAVPEDQLSAEKGSGYVSLLDRLNFFRATFCGTDEVIKIGITRFGKVLAEFFEQD